MVIFHSYVSLPEGSHIRYYCTVLSPIFQLGTHMSTSYLDDTVLDPAEMDVTDVVSILFPWTNGTVLIFSFSSAPN